VCVNDSGMTREERRGEKCVTLLWECVTALGEEKCVRRMMMINRPLLFTFLLSSLPGGLEDPGGVCLLQSKLGVICDCGKEEKEERGMMHPLIASHSVRSPFSHAF
jgi:hypothetical protein